MSEDAAHNPELEGPELVGKTDAERVVRAMEQWRRRSRLIKFFRRALPAAIGAVLLSLFGWMGIKALLANLPNLQGKGAEIVMTNPHFYGQDDKGQSFVLAAKEARRQMGGRQLITLDALLLKLSTGPNRTLQISARKGTFDQAAHSARVEGAVQLSDSGAGYSFTTQRAVIDTKTSDVTGDTPISGHGPIGEISASSYGISDRGAHMSFSGNVHTRIYQTHQGAAPAKGGGR